MFTEDSYTEICGCIWKMEKEYIYVQDINIKIYCFHGENIIQVLDMAKDILFWHRTKEEETEDEIKLLEKRVQALESLHEPIGFADAQVYCIECGHIAHYNYYKPFTAPSKCSKCSGRMTDKQTEETMKSLEKHLKKLGKTIKKKKKLNMKQHNPDKLYSDDRNLHSKNKKDIYSIVL